MNKDTFVVEETACEVPPKLKRKRVKKRKHRRTEEPKVQYKLAPEWLALMITRAPEPIKFDDENLPSNSSVETENLPSNSSVETDVTALSTAPPAIPAQIKPRRDYTWFFRLLAVLGISVVFAFITKDEEVKSTFWKIVEWFGKRFSS